MDGEIMKRIGKRIRHQRDLLKLSREKFAEQADISPQFLSEIENGKKGMSAETLYKICNRFGVSADYLLFGKDIVSKSKSNNPLKELVDNFDEPYLPAIEDVLRSLTQIVTIKKKIES